MGLKPWYLSRTIWASLISVALAGGAALGLPIDEVDEGEVADLLIQGVAVACGLVAIWGRIAATTRIG